MGIAEGVVAVALISLLIGVIIMAGEMFKRFIEFKEHKLALNSDGAGHAAQVERLEARVRMLERIATDRGHDVAHQIEALRDQRGAETPVTGRVAQGAG